MSFDNEERELPPIQRGLVDTCFEEAQYESGIDVLFSLCSPRYKPPPLHIRHLVYMSLYPPPPRTANSDASTNKLPDATLSPQKLRLQKDDIWPKPSAREKALALLQSYVNINSPQSLMRAFPFYPYVNESGTNDVDPFGNENLENAFHEDNTPLRNEVLNFQSLKDCWGCLKDGFVKRKHQDSVSRSKRLTTLDDNTSEEPMFVGPYAWPILEWLVTVFEKDQALQYRTGGMRISPLLLIQIPPPKIRQGPRIGLDVPLEIIKECFIPPSNLDASDSGVDNSHLIPERRQELGMRLLSLLSNLTLTNPPLLSSSQLINRLAITLRSFEPDYLHAFLPSFSSHQAVFKLNILESLLARNEDRIAIPAAKARAKPRVRGVDQVRSDRPSKESETVREAYVVPSVERVAVLLSSRVTHGEDAKADGLIKYHLVSALFQARDNVDLMAFDGAIKAGSLRKFIEEGFGKSQSVARYKEITLDIVKAWEKRI